MVQNKIKSKIFLPASIKMDQIRASIHGFQHPSFPDYIGQVEFFPPEDSFFASVGYALVSRVLVMKSNAQDLCNRLQEFCTKLNTAPLQSVMYTINSGKTDRDPIAAINELYQEGGCEDLAESIKAILIAKLIADNKHSAAKDIANRKPVDIETDVCFNALNVEADVAIQLYKFDGTVRTIHRQNVRTSISLYVDEYLNWSVLIHQNENEFSSTHNVDLLRSVPFKYGHTQRGFSPMKIAKLGVSMAPPPPAPEPEDPDLVIKQLIEALAGVVDKQKIAADRDIKNDLKKFIQDFQKLKPEWKLRQLEGLETYLNNLSNCNHENCTRVFSFCGATHCVECLKEKISREKLERKADIKCPCGQKVANQDCCEFGLMNILQNFGKKTRDNHPGTSSSTAPMGGTASPEVSISKKPSIASSTCFICNERISARENRVNIDGQFVHGKCAAQSVPKPVYQETISMKICQLCKINTSPSNILCERNHYPLCRSCAIKWSNGVCPYCKASCHYCKNPIDTSKEDYTPFADGIMVHNSCYYQYNPK
ncbi:unnamed protein product [Blepharisma stoltei]|uniref:RING-type domain-containing protein n=1 Tax=Blepharisma stoltei TaxID=1481888 RepID=A0AAU9J7Z7_9CILI|nr:unnamed protein product [Blepharisma stoltei]